MLPRSLWRIYPASDSRARNDDASPSTRAPHNWNLFSVSIRDLRSPFLPLLSLFHRNRRGSPAKTSRSFSQTQTPAARYMNLREECSSRVQCTRFVPSLWHAPRYMSLYIMQKLFPSGAILEANGRKRSCTVFRLFSASSILLRFLLFAGALCKHDTAGDDM